MTSSHSISPYLVGAISAAFVLGWLTRRNRRNGGVLPPGPKRLPLIGNLLDLPKEKDWETYRSWNERYGEIVYVEALGSKMVILSSATVINELLEQRGAIYSDRPRTVMASELLGIEWITATTPYGEAWRTARRLLHSHLHQGAVTRYQPIQIASARKLAQAILVAKQDVGAVSHIVRSNFGRLMMEMTYGIESEKTASEQLSLAEKWNEVSITACTPGRFLVDVFTFLKYIPEWFPGADFKRFAREGQAISRRVRDDPIAIVKTDMINGTAPPSVAHSMLADDAFLPPERSEIDIIKNSTAGLYLAGSDTTVAAIESFFLAMLVYPEVQRKAQAEIDRVIDHDRLPEFEDAPRLPYVQGVVNECLRWLPVAPLALPHSTSRDDVYNGYIIPKGTMVLANAWAILHDPEYYPDPEVFNPSRFLTLEGALDPSVRDPRSACFGFGRRTCPGRHIATESLFAVVSTLLAAVDVVRAKDAEGNEMVPVVDVTSDIASHPKPFPWAVRCRNQHAEELLSHALASF